MIRTARLRLVSATVELVDLERVDPTRLAAALGVELPRDWPPEHHDDDVLAFVRKELEDPGAAGWWLHYVVLDDATAPVLVGTAGYKGPPREGVVEIGYSIVPSHRRHGYATEASQALIDAAWASGAETVVAHTLPELEPSIGVLRKLGFDEVESANPGELEFALARRRGYAVVTT